MSDSEFDFTKAHELLDLKLRFHRQLSREKVIRQFVELDFVWSDEDFGYLPRRDKVKPWQASNICNFELIAADSPTMCAGVDFQILFSALPPDCHKVFLTMLKSVQELLGGQFEYAKKELSYEALIELFHQCTHDLKEEFAEIAGSEFLQRLIQEFRYQQKAF